MDNYYFIKIDSIEDEEAESYSIDTVSVEIELWFLLANKKDNYSVSVDKANTIKKAIKALLPSESTFHIYPPQNLKVDGLNNIIKNNWLKCSINFDIGINDDE